MAAKLGASDAAFRLGNQAVSVYLGAVEVYSPSATLYFNGAADALVNDAPNWSNLGNWWTDEGHTVPAASLPAVVDDVFISFIVEVTPEGSATVANATFTGQGSLFAGAILTVTGNATFNDNTNNGGIITGNATFNDSSVNYGEVTGTATFIGSACNLGGTAGTFVPNPPPACPE